MQLSFDNGLNIKTPCLSIIDKQNQYFKSQVSYFFITFNLVFDLFIVI
jgi:hypothetical protein